MFLNVVNYSAVQILQELHDVTSVLSLLGEISAFYGHQKVGILYIHLIIVAN